MKYFGIFLLGVVGLIILSGLLWGIGVATGIVTLFPHQISNKVDTAHGIIDKTYNADNAIYNYHWFKEKDADIKTAGQNLDNAQQSFDSFETSLPKDHTQWSFEDKTEDSRLRQVLLGSKNYYNDLVNDYDAHAKEVDRTIFQDLPTIIPLR